MPGTSHSSQWHTGSWHVTFRAAHTQCSSTHTQSLRLRIRYIHMFTMTSAMDRLCDTKWVNNHLQCIIWRRNQQYTAEYDTQVTQYWLDKIKQTPRKPCLFGCQFAHHESYKRSNLGLCGNNWPHGLWHDNNWTRKNMEESGATLTFQSGCRVVKPRPEAGTSGNSKETTTTSQNALMCK